MTRRLTLLLALILSGCATLTPVTPEQAQGLKEAQRIADDVTKAYGTARIHVEAVDDAGPRAAASYHPDGAYFGTDRILIKPTYLVGKSFSVVLSHELGHATLGHQPARYRVRGEDYWWAQKHGVELQIPEWVRAYVADHEHTANRRGVEILIRFFGLSQDEALGRYAAYMISANIAANALRTANASRKARTVAFHMPSLAPAPCEQLRELWSSFGQTAPACEIWTAEFEVKDCPYDDWMSTGCKAGQPLAHGDAIQPTPSKLPATP